MGAFFSTIYMKRKVAIQGIGGCNHHIAARRFFGADEIETIDCDTFRELALRVQKDPSILGIMAIENTIAGSILPNYQIIRESDLVIVGEYKLRIEHSLIAHPGVDIHQIDEINSHPMALMQCQDFLDTLPNVKLVEKDDTAGSLSKVLTILSFYDMNLTMIQSLPIVGKEWEYQFYINLLFDDYKRYRSAIDAILPLCKEFKILGEYENCAC